MTTQLPQLNQSVLLAKEWLNAFAESTNFIDILTQTFGSLFDRSEAQAIRQKWILGEFSDLPVIELLSGSILQGANGAYAASRNTIYLSQDYLQANINNPASIASVLVEEIGHYLDYRLNSKDTPGDEGEIFSALVRGVSLSQQQLQVMQVEDDRATITVDGQQVQVEQSGGYSIIQLTNNSKDDVYPSISDNNVAWIGGSDNDYEIYLYNGSSTIQLTNNSYDSFNYGPSISGNNVVWEGYDGNDSEIYLYNGSSTKKLTNNSYFDGYPSISGNNVVWYGNNDNDPNDSVDGGEIYLYNGSSTKKLTNNSTHDSHPSISGNKVVWYGYDGNDYEIYLYNGRSTKKLTNNSYDEYEPSISGKNVVWYGYDGNDYEIYLYNGSSTIQLTNNSYHDSDPSISDKNVVWSGDGNIYLYNGSSTIQLSNNGYHPSISGNNVVWYGYDGNASEIYLATLDTPQISIADSTVTVAAGEDQTACIEFTVRLSKISDVPITVEYYTDDGTADDGIPDPDDVEKGVDKKDYESTKGQLTFLPGQKLEQTVKVKVYGDTPINDKTLEIFAKDTAYRDWSEGADVDAGLTYGDLGYRVDKIFNDTNTSYDAVGLTSDEEFFLFLTNATNAAIVDETAEGIIYDLGKTPVLANRGTQEIPQDVLSDANVNGAGYDQFYNNNTQISNWLSNVSSLEGTNSLEVRPNITGHSLGGALTQWIGASYQGNLGKIATFNSPGISSLQGINLNANNNLGVQHYINAGDLISLAGADYLSGVYNLGKYSKLLSAIKLEKHSVPFLFEYNARINLQKPADLTISADKTTDSLSSFFFTYLPNRDYFVIQTAFASLGLLPVPGTTLIGSYLAANLTFRGTVEINRKAIGLAIDAVQQAISSGQITYSQLQSVWDASQSWVNSAWDTIIDQSKQKLGLSSTTSTTNNNLLSTNLNSFVQSSNAPENLIQSQLFLNTANTQNATPTVNDFWDAVPMWSTDAWQASANWSSETWKSINEWTPQTFQASTTWAADTWKQPFISVLNNTVLEGDPNTSNLTFTVALSTASTQAITVNYATTNGTAIAGNDYVATNGILTFNPGETVKTITVAVIDDTLNEPDETFTIELSNPINANLPQATASGTITDTLQLRAIGPDFNRDGQTDILWRNGATGDNAVWLMNDTNLAQGISITPVADTNWDIGGTGDFNSDGQTDILWRNAANGENAVWLMNGTNLTQGVSITPVAGTNWSIGGTGDFNGDNKTDIVWRDELTGQNAIWLMNGTGIAQAVFTTPVADTNWYIAGAGDFNGDNQTDILWRDELTGQNAVWLMNGTNLDQAKLITPVADANWGMGGTGDYNRDGQTDILWRNQSNGQDAVWLMNGTNLTQGVSITPVSDTNWHIGA